MKIAHSLCLLGILATISLGLARTAAPASPANELTSREQTLTAQLTIAAHAVLRPACGQDVPVTVTVRCGRGFRKQHLVLFPGEDTRFGYVVKAVQEKHEAYEGKQSQDEELEDTASSSGKNGYQQSMRSESRQSSGVEVDFEEQAWVERIGVCVVVPAGDPAQLESALFSALALDPVRGDTVKVLVKG